MGLTNNLGKLSNMITSTGSAVGIAQPSPAYTLDVSGTGRFGGTGTYNGFLISSHSNNVGAAIYNKALANATLYADSASTVLNAESNLYLRTGNTDRMTLTSAGNVLIGTTSAGSDLTRIAAAQASANNLGLLTTDDASGGTFIVFRNSAGNNIGNISRVATTNAVAYSTTSSDLRLKKNIDIWNENVIDLFKDIKPVVFNFNDEENGNEKMKGFIAQEMIDKFPEAYPLGRDDYYTYNPSGMVVYLMKAIQELSAQNQDLKSRLDKAGL